MAQKKHFVLDHDVYLRLMRRKRETGITASRLGNGILRACLDGSVSLLDLLRESLVKSGKLTDEEFFDAVRETIAAFRETRNDFGGHLPEDGQDSAEIGSWKVRRIRDSIENGHRVFCFEARNARKRQFPLHFHEEDAHVMVVSGEILFEVNCTQSMHRAPSSLLVRSGSIHSATPLSPDASFISILTPSS